MKNESDKENKIITRYKYQDEILKICKRNHFTANEILKKVRNKYKKAGQATIYRTINFLVEKKILNKISHRNTNYYETLENFHAHIVEKNKKLKDISLPKYFLEEIEDKTGKKIKALDFKIFI